MALSGASPTARQAGQNVTPWLIVVLVVILFSGGLFGYDQGVISGAIRGMTSSLSVSRLVVEVVVPDIDQAHADKLIIDAVRKALNDIEQEQLGADPLGKPLARHLALPGSAEARKESSSFLKKRTKKLLPCLVGAD